MRDRDPRPLRRQKSRRTVRPLERSRPVVSVMPEEFRWRPRRRRLPDPTCRSLPRPAGPRSSRRRRKRGAAASVRRNSGHSCRFAAQSLSCERRLLRRERVSLFLGTAMLISLPAMSRTAIPPSGSASVGTEPGNRGKEARKYPETPLHQVPLKVITQGCVTETASGHPHAARPRFAATCDGGRIARYPAALPGPRSRRPLDSPGSRPAKPREASHLRNSTGAAPDFGGPRTAVHEDFLHAKSRPIGSTIFCRQG